MSNPCAWTDPPQTRFAQQMNSYTVTVLPNDGALRGRYEAARRQLRGAPSSDPTRRLDATPRRQCR